MNSHTLGVIGIGKLGLSFALLAEQSGYTVLGCDNRPDYVADLNRKQYTISEPYINQYLQTNTKFTATTDMEQVLLYTDMVFCFVATPSLPDGSYDHSAIETVVADIQRLHIMGVDMSGKTLVIGCTTMPGYTQTVSDMLECTGMKVAYNPEFIAQGSIIDGLRNADMVLMGVSEDSTFHALQGIYRTIMGKEPVISRMSPTAAEITKISINCFLAMKIAYANMIGEIAINSQLEPEIPTILKAIGSDSRIGHKYLGYGFGYGGPCVLPTQDIITKRGLIQIQDIRKGDYVLSHDGMFNVVTKVFKREYDGDIHTFSMEGFAGDTLTITPEHPIYACKRPGSRYYTTGGKRKLVSVSCDNLKTLSPSFIEADGLLHGDFFVIPKLLTENNKTRYIHITGDIKGANRVPSKIELTPSVMRLFGYWLAEGHTDAGKSIAFTFHQDELAFHDDVKTLLQEHFNLRSSVCKKGVTKGVRIKATSQKLTRFIDSTFGKGCDNKRIPYEWLELSDEHLINLLRGMWYGDGSNSTGRFTWVTVSKEMFTFCKLALYRLGVLFSSNISKSSVRKGITRRTAYYIRISKKTGIETFNGIIPIKAIDMKTNDSGDKNTTFWNDDSLFYRIKDKTTNNYKGLVYNIEVANANSYMLTSSVVHNCIPRDGRALSVYMEDCNIKSRIPVAADNANDAHAKFLLNYYIRQNPHKGFPFQFTQLTYKKGVDILTESQQYRLCKDLLEAGYSVAIDETDNVLAQAQPELIQYGNRVIYGTIDNSYKIGI